MKVSPIALGVTLGLLWGGAMCVISILHAFIPGYGVEFFRFMGSIYPGIEGTGTLGDAVIAVLYGLADGFFGGFVIAWLYNQVAARTERG